MTASPFTDREMEILRGMIDEYEFARQRRRLWGKRLGFWQRVIVALGATVALVLPFVNLILNLSH